RHTKLKNIRRDYGEQLKEQRNRLKKLAEEVGSGDKGTLAFRQQLAAENQDYLRRQRQDVQSQRRKLEARLKARVRPDDTAEVAAPSDSYSEADIDRAIEAQPRIAALTAQLADAQEKLDSHQKYVRRLSRTGSDPSLPPLRERV